MKMLGWMILVVLVSTPLCLTAGPAQSCSGFDTIAALPYSELIQQSQTIVLARLEDVTSIEPGAVPKQDKPLTKEELLEMVDQRQPKHVYKFKVLETLKGTAEDHLTIETVGVSHQSGSSDFQGHTDYRFWLDKGGRLAVEADCSFRPTFEKGSAYLLFLTDEPHPKGYELIRAPDDAWLAEVRRVLAQEALISGKHASTTRTSP